jgi:hypothetical protein
MTYGDYLDRCLSMVVKTMRRTYCHCGDPADGEDGLCSGCRLDAQERESLQSGDGPIVQVAQIGGKA